ncbi:MAG: hypothetical protein IKA64_01905 [Clostridia bacterium]|nr:hypothetical protein [Clostridia bacterium]
MSDTIIKDYKLTIFKLKKKLSNTDYMALKFAEGELSEDEFSPMREKRREWRAEINRLEECIRSIREEMKNA